jgi:uncharacterized protein (TIGR02217 family)
MAFYNQLFPPCIGRNMEAGPTFVADVAWTVAGQRAYNLYDPLPLREYTLAVPVRQGEEFEELVAFFLVTRGLDPFLFKDWSDYRATRANTSMTPIAGSVYQMNRVYPAPGRTATRPVYKPAAGARIWRTRSGVATDITGTSTVSATTGRVTVVGHTSGDTYNWEGEFYVPVYFSDPRAVWNVIGNPNMLTEWAGLTLRESREIA